MAEFGPDVIIDIQTNKKTFHEKTPEEETARLDEIALAEAEETKRQEEAQKRKDAIGRLKLSSNKDIIDLLEVLGIAQD